MLKLIRQKMKNKRWLTACLTLGMTFLVAVFVCQPMFKQGALNMLLRSSFYNYTISENKYPAVIGREDTHEGDAGGLEAVLSEIDGYDSTWFKYLEDINALESQTRVKLASVSVLGSYAKRGSFMALSYIPEFGQHITLVDGQFYDSEFDTAAPAEGNNESAMIQVVSAIDDGCYPCLISQKIMDERGFVVGEILTSETWKNKNGEKLKLVVSGIYKAKDISDSFWYIEPDDFRNEIFVSREAVNAILEEYTCAEISYSHYVMLDYEDITSKNVEDVKYYIEQFALADSNFVVTFMPLLESYMADKQTIGILLWVLQLPILGMVLAFIYMVSSQIAESEKNEIAMQRSRGLSRFQIIVEYTAQCGILALYGLIIGLPLGYGLCKLCAKTTDFLTFSGGGAYLYGFTAKMLAYGGIAVVLGAIVIIIPIVSYSKITIVEHKSMNATRNKVLWERFFIDIVLLGMSLYLLRNFNIQKDKIRLDVMLGNKMDPLIFLDSTLFIIGFGLLALRLSHYLVRLVYRIGKNKWRPAMYASFLQITRTFGKQGFISVFMILTVAMGLFNANAARTINQNNEDRLEYGNGADAVVMDKWVMKTFKDINNQYDYKYEEPDYARFERLTDSSMVVSQTRVLKLDNTKITKSGITNNVTLMGIYSKEFGETANFKEELNKDVHWYTYLNELAKNPDGVIISSNLAKVYDFKIGDIVSTSRMGDTDFFADKPRGGMTGVVCAIVDDWPGYERYYYEEGEEKERYLVVANYPKVVSAYQIAPYEVWVKLNGDVDMGEFTALLDESKIVPKDVKLLQKDISDMKQQPIIQITNGMFTLSFIIALVLCAIGFLIYWISSIKQRELLFGVYRAMGLPVKELNTMLTNEHIFSTFLSVIAGGGVGIVSTQLFVKLFGIVYLPEKHNLDIYIYSQMGDIMKLVVVIALMIVVCMFVLRRLIKSLNITQALKLGEE